MKRRILLVDDEATLLFAVGQYLNDAGLEVDCATEKEEAEALFSNISFDVVITDIRLTSLQGAEGLRVLDFIRHRNASTPVIVLTAHASPEVEREARRLGAAAIFYKPVALPTLEAEIRRLCQERS